MYNVPHQNICNDKHIMEGAITFQPFAFLNRHLHKGGKTMLTSDCLSPNLDLQNDESHLCD